MNLYETDVYGQPRKILKFLAEQGPQPSLTAIARAIGDNTAETLGYWRTLEQQGLVHRAAGKGIAYALACRLSLSEQDPTRYQSAYYGAKRKKQEQVGDCLSRVMDLLEEFHGIEFQCKEIAEGAFLDEVVALCNLNEILVRMARNGLISVRHVSAKTVLYSSADSHGLTEVEDYLRTHDEQWHPTRRVIAGTGRPAENVRMVLRVLQYRGAILKEKRYRNQCWWKWRGMNE